MRIPQTRYARSADGTFIAYHVVGDGPVTVVCVPGFVWHIEIGWEHPDSVRFQEALARIGRLVVFDKRGTGLSDRVSPLTDLDTRAQDMLAVMDAVGCERAVLVGEYEGGALAAFVAASFPQRVQAFAWWGAWAKAAWAPDNPLGMTEEEYSREQADIERRWGTIGYVRSFLQDEGSRRGDDPSIVAWWAKLFRFAASPAEAMRFFQMWWETDVTAILPLIRVPTLLAFRDGTEATAQVHEVADRIAGSERILLPPGDPVPMGDTGVLFADRVRDFVSRVQGEEADLDRVLATVLFSDIVDSTSKAAELGDHAWRSLVEEHHRIVRGLLDRFRGVEIDTAGDGFFATFDGPARAVRCARAIVEAVRPLQIEVRVGIHTGEVETIANKAGGLAVNIGARVAGLAEASEVLVSSTVKDLVAGSGLAFGDAGEHELKGVPDRWRLYRVVG